MSTRDSYISPSAFAISLMREALAIFDADGDGSLLAAARLQHAIDAVGPSLDEPIAIKSPPIYSS